MTGMTVEEQFHSLDALRLVHHVLNRDLDAASVLLEGTVGSDPEVQKFCFAIAQIAVTYGEQQSSRLQMSSWIRRAINSLGRP